MVLGVMLGASLPVHLGTIVVDVAVAVMHGDPAVGLGFGKLPVVAVVWIGGPGDLNEVVFQPCYRRILEVFGSHTWKEAANYHSFPGCAGTCVELKALPGTVICLVKTMLRCRRGWRTSGLEQQLSKIGNNIALMILDNGTHTGDGLDGKAITVSVS